MADPFFDLSALSLNTSAQQNYQAWLAQMQAAFPGYNPSAGNLEVIQAQIFASFAADLGDLCNTGSDQLFQQFGTDLVGIPFEPGQAAVATLTVTAIDTSGYTLPAGTQVTLTLNGAPLGFSTLTDLTIPNGSPSGTVQVLAALPGTAYNGAGDPADLVSTLDLNWVSNLATAAVASEGLDPELPSDYLNRLKGQLQLMAPRPITASDYATMALSFQPDTTTDQEEVGRATALDGYDPGPQTFVVSTTSSSAAVTVTTPPFTNVTAFPGATVEGSFLPSGTTSGSQTFPEAIVTMSATPSAFPSSGQLSIAGVTGLVSYTGKSGSTFTGCTGGTGTAAGGAAVGFAATVLSSPAPTSTSFSMSTNATATGTNENATLYGSINNEREVTVAITAADGTTLNSDTLAAVQAWLESLREANFIVNVIDPTYSTVYVTVSIHPLATFNSSDVQSAVQEAIVNFLTPANWGLPVSSVAGWTNYTTIYTSKLAAVVQNTAGVDYIQDGSLKLGLSSSPSGTVDLLLPGPVALPQATDASVTVSLV